jgi:hypothetical protein
VHPIGRVAALLLLVAMSALLTLGPAQAAGGCHKINAKGEGQDLGGGVTHAQVIGGGLLHGTTDGNFSVTGVSGAEASIAGTVKFTANNATLTVSVSGTLNLSNGAFNASGPVTASAGKLTGASGDLEFGGIEDLGDGSFTETIDGTVCLV